MVYHYFSDVGIWGKSGQEQKRNSGLTRKWVPGCRFSCEIVMRDEHEIGTKSSCMLNMKLAHIMMRAEHENGYGITQNHNDELIGTGAV